MQMKASEIATGYWATWLGDTLQLYPPRAVFHTIWNIKTMRFYPLHQESNNAPAPFRLSVSKPVRRAAHDPSTGSGRTVED
ncbi:MAG: hypothetical protein RIS44_452 [Pseudomonadota bacterium]|jgi:hypothetical protein